MHQRWPTHQPAAPQSRDEHWLVVAGQGELECDGHVTAAAPGTSLAVPRRAVHRISAGACDLILVEVQLGAPLSEADIERLADDYGRSTP